MVPTGVGRRFPIRAVLLVFAGYYLGARLGFALTFQPTPVSTLWSPNAILLAAFLIVPRRAWIGILAGALPAHLLAELGAGVPFTMVLAWFVSNASEALIGAAGVLHFRRQPFRLDRLGNVGIFIVVAALIAPFLSSFLDAGLVAWIGWGDSGYWQVWESRFFSNTLATMIVVPVILAWSQQDFATLARASFRRYGEAFAVALGLLLVALFVFAPQPAGPRIVPGLIYAPLPFLIWSAVRYGPIGVSTSLLFVVFLAIWNAVHGRGPFATQTPEANALTMQLLFSGVSGTLISLAAVIDERRRAQEEARQSGEQLRLALDAAQMSAWNWSIAETLEPMPNGPGNRESEPGASGSMSRWLESVHPEDRAAVGRAIDRSIAQSIAYEKEFRVVRDDGSTGWVMGRGKILLDDDGEPARLIGIHADVTERKSAEALSIARNSILEMIAAGAPLHDSLTRLTLMVEAEAPGILCSVLILDSDGVHLRHGAAPNLPQAYVRALDGIAIGPCVGSYGTAMYLGRPIFTTDILKDVLWSDYRELASAHGLRACWSTPLLSRKSKVLGAFAMYYRSPRGPSRREMELVDFATQLGTIALERHIEEARAEEQRHELAHLGRVALLGGLSGALAHELSQPLAAILSDAQAGQRLLARDPPDIGEVREILGDIVTAHERAGMVIERLRGLLANRHAEFTPLDMNNVVNEALQLLKGALTDRHVYLDVDMDPDLGPVMGDRVQLIQVLLNLLMNSCEAMTSTPPAERLIKVATWASADGAVHVAVSDQGTGIPQELMGRVGEPFVTSKPRGLGLGLSISRSILIAHGGGLRPENNPDRGATFQFVLPAAPTTSLRS